MIPVGEGVDHVDWATPQRRGGCGGMEVESETHTREETLYGFCFQTLDW